VDCSLQQQEKTSSASVPWVSRTSLASIIFKFQVDFGMEGIEVPEVRVLEVLEQMGELEFAR